MNRWLRRLGYVLLMGLASCGGGDDAPAPVSPAPPITEPAPGPQPRPVAPPLPTPAAPAARASTTMLVYMVGSDLESRDHAATANIEEMLSATATRDVNVLLQMGGANKPGWHTVRRQRISDGKLTLLEDMGSFSLGQPQVLSDFIRWGMATYPAERYMLVFWNHGGGPNGGFGFDENFHHEHLSLPQLSAAVRDGLKGSDARFELIGFDACLMASVEIAQALQPYGKYLAASQDVEPGPGWDWQAIMNELAARPLMQGDVLGRVIADSFVAKQIAADEGDYVTFSITDLQAVPALTTALAEAAGAVDARLQVEGADAWLDVAYARQHALDFDTGPFFGGMRDLVDVLDFLRQPALQVPPAQLAAVESAMAATVIHDASGPKLAPISGLTLYFPSRSATDARTGSAYAALDVAAPLKSWVQRYAGMAQSGVVSPPQIGTPALVGTDVVASIDNLHFATSFVALTGQRSIYAMKPAFVGAQGLQANTREWLALDGVPVAVLPDESQFAVDSARYTIPVSVLDDKDEGTVEGLLAVTYTQDLAGRERYEIDGFFAADEGFSAAARRSRKLEPGMKVLPLRFHLDWKMWMSDGATPALVVPEDDVPWLLQKTTLPLAGLHLGVNDYLSQIHLSPVMP